MAVRLKIEEADYLLRQQMEESLILTRDFVNSLTDPMLDFLVYHEVLHCVFDSCRQEEIESQLYNAAADYNINMTLVEQNVGEPITEDKLGGGKIVLIGNTVGTVMRFMMTIKNRKDAKGMDVHLEEMKPGDEDGEGKGIGAELSEEEKKALADEIKQAAIKRHKMLVWMYRSS